MPINQPSNQIKLTNVSLVRLKKAKKRFEIACYKNKVLEWRNGIETDLDNVLQIQSVFLNVSKGQTAPSADLAKAFGPKTSVNDIILEILAKGELQVGEKERHAALERVHNEVVGIVASKLVDREGFGDVEFPGIASSECRKWNGYTSDWRGWRSETKGQGACVDWSRCNKECKISSP
jgi:rRNA metabolism SBDS family protein